MGIISGLGVGQEATLSHIKSCRTSVSEISYLETIHRELLSAEVRMSNREMVEYLGLPEDIKINRTCLLGLIALKEAVEQAGWRAKDGVKRAFINGTTVGGMDCSEKMYEEFFEGKNIDYIALHDCGASTEIMSDYLGDVDINTTLSTACSSAANAIILGANMIKSGRVEMAMVGGSECLSKFHLNGFNTLKILDSKPCRPFDQSREGLNLGEGAAYLLMETETSAKRRNARILAELSAYGNACDAFHQTATSPCGEGAFLAMTEALETGGFKPEDIDYINAHGTGTVNNDETENEAIRRVFGKKIPPVSSTKAYTGHTTSASGSIEAVISILSMQNSIIPPNLHFSKAMENAAFIPVLNLESKTLRNVMSNSFGFGGNDSCCIFSKYM